MSEPQGFFPRFGNALFDHRKLVLLIVMLITAWFAWHIPAVRMLSDFADLLPQQHPYIKLHNSIRDTFGGANIITMAVEVEEGTVFTNETLSRIQRITDGMDANLKTLLQRFSRSFLKGLLRCHKQASILGII